MVLRVGVRYYVNKTICSSRDECESKNPVLELGKIYEVQVVTDKPINEANLYEAIKIIRQQYPSVSINYIEINGNKLIMQIFDPVFKPQVHPVYIIVILGLVLGILIGAKYVIEEIRILVSETLPGGHPPPEWMWYVIGFGAVATSTAVLIYSVKK